MKTYNAKTFQKNYPNADENFAEAQRVWEKADAEIPLLNDGVRMAAAHAYRFWSLIVNRCQCGGPFPSEWAKKVYPACMKTLKEAGRLGALPEVGTPQG